MSIDSVVGETDWSPFLLMILLLQCLKEKGNFLFFSLVIAFVGILLDFIGDAFN